MKFGTFLFPDSRDPARRRPVIDETVREAGLADRLGVDIVWLAEHHFDGISVYADPMVCRRAGRFGDTGGSRLRGDADRAASPHPAGRADGAARPLMKGRLIVGLGRGSSYNIYDYQGFGIDHHEAQARLDEAEAILLRAWTRRAFEHHGRFWQLDVPMLRPRPYTRPHPPVIRGRLGRRVDARAGPPGQAVHDERAVDRRPRRRVGLYRETMQQAGFDEAAIAGEPRGQLGVAQRLVAGATTKPSASGSPRSTRCSRRVANARPHPSRHRPAHRSGGGRSAAGRGPRAARVYPRLAGEGRRGCSPTLDRARHRRGARLVPARTRWRMRSRPAASACSCARWHRGSAAMRRRDNAVPGSRIDGRTGAVH